MKSSQQLLLLVLLAGMLLCSCSARVSSDIESRLKAWRKGVWISGSGTYTIYTDTHYFVLSYEGDSTSANLYCGASQVRYCNKGMARKQVVRLRQMPNRGMQLFKESVFHQNNSEQPLEIDTTLFAPGVCNVKNGVIYDSVTEVTDEYILLATCNGDKEQIYANGVAAYMPAGGGEFYSYRIETF